MDRDRTSGLHSGALPDHLTSSHVSGSLFCRAFLRRTGIRLVRERSKGSVAHRMLAGWFVMSGRSLVGTLTSLAGTRSFIEERRTRDGSVRGPGTFNRPNPCAEGMSEDHRRLPQARSHESLQEAACADAEPPWGAVRSKLRRTRKSCSPRRRGKPETSRRSQLGERSLRVRLPLGEEHSQLRSPCPLLQCDNSGIVRGQCRADRADD